MRVQRCNKPGQPRSFKGAWAIWGEIEAGVKKARADPSKKFSLKEAFFKVSNYSGNAFQQCQLEDQVAKIEERIMTSKVTKAGDIKMYAEFMNGFNMYRGIPLQLEPTPTRTSNLMCMEVPEGSVQVLPAGGGRKEEGRREERRG